MKNSRGHTQMIEVEQTKVLGVGNIPTMSFRSRFAGNPTFISLTAVDNSIYQNIKKIKTINLSKELKIENKKETL